MQVLHCRARIAYEEQIDTPNVKFANDSGISNAGFGDGNPEIRINSWTFNFIYKTIMSYISICKIDVRILQLVMSINLLIFFFKNHNERVVSLLGEKSMVQFPLIH